MPAITNGSGEERIHGWCGTTDDWAVVAHGEYASLEAARAAITEIFGEVREYDQSDEDEEDIVETYKPGKFVEMSSQATADWAYDLIQEDIKADTTDERIAELVAGYEEEANHEGGSLHSDLEDFMRDYRQQLRDAIEDEDED